MDPTISRRSFMDGASVSTLTVSATSFGLCLLGRPSTHKLSREVNLKRNLSAEGCGDVTLKPATIAVPRPVSARAWAGPPTAFETSKPQTDDALLGAPVLSDALNQIEVAVAVNDLLTDEHGLSTADSRRITI